MSTEPTTGPVDVMMPPDEFDFEQEDFTPPNAALMQVVQPPAKPSPDAARGDTGAFAATSATIAQVAANEEVERPRVDAARSPREQLHSPEEAARLREVNERAIREHHARQRSTRPPGANAPPKAEKQRPRPDDVEGPLDALLRDRDALLDVIEQGKGLVSVARVMLLTVVVCAAALGASVGMYRGGVQILFAAIKLPMVLLLTTAVCAPVYTTLKLGMRQPASLLKDFALVLSALALSSVVAASLSPLLLLAIFNGYAYHTLTLLLVAICGLGGMCGFLFFVRGLRRQVERAERLVYLVFLCVIGVVSMQFSWLARPYLVRPQTDEVPFMRAIEGSFFEAVRVSTDSARGIYSYPDKFSARSSSAYYGRGATYERTVPARDVPVEAVAPPKPLTQPVDTRAGEAKDSPDALLHVEARETEAMLVGRLVEEGDEAEANTIEDGAGEADVDIAPVKARDDAEVSP